MQDYIIKPVNIEDLRHKIVRHSKLKEEIDLDQLIDDDQEEVIVLNSINYIETDKLFLANMVRYQEFLKKTIDEFEINLQEMIVTIRNIDLESFRKIHHRMKSILSTLNMHDLDSVIEDIKDKLKEEKTQLDVDSEISNLKYQFDFVRDSLINKLSSLKWH